MVAKPAHQVVALGAIKLALKDGQSKPSLNHCAEEIAFDRSSKVLGGYCVQPLASTTNTSVIEVRLEVLIGCTAVPDFPKLFCFQGFRKLLLDQGIIVAQINLVVSGDFVIVASGRVKTIHTEHQQDPK